MEKFTIYFTDDLAEVKTIRENELYIVHRDFTNKKSNAQMEIEKLIFDYVCKNHRAFCDENSKTDNPEFVIWNY